MFNPVDPIELYYEALDEAVEGISGSDDLKTRVYSIALFGSLPRGDFVHGESDIDLMLILEWPRVMGNEGWKEFEEFGAPVRDAFASRFKGIPVPESRGYILDLPTIPRGHLPLRGSGVPLDPSFDYLVFKYLGVYRFDIRYWRILYGVDFRPELADVDCRALMQVMAASILDRVRSADSVKAVLGIAVHAIRLSQAFYGEETLDKRRVMMNFMARVPDFPLKHLAQGIWGLGERMNLVSEGSVSVESVREFISQLVGPLLS